MRTRLNLSPRRRWVAAAVVFTLTAVVATGSMAGPDDGYLGVYMQPISKDLRNGLDLKVDNGVLIRGVADGSPAEAAGIEKGDVIVKFDGKDVDSPRDLRELVEDVEPGSSVEIELVRDGKTMTVTATVGEEPDDIEMWFDDGDFHHFRNMRHGWGGLNRFASINFGPRLGVQATELNDDLADYFKTKANGGVLVLDVEDDSVAKAAGVKAGDVIQKIADEDVTSISDIRDAISDYDEGDEFDISVLRKGKKETLKATMDDQDRTMVFRNGKMHLPREVRGFRDRDRDQLREDLDQLREELRELKRELGRDEG